MTPPTFLRISDPAGIIKNFFRFLLAKNLTNVYKFSARDTFELTWHLFFNPAPGGINLYFTPNKTDRRHPTIGRPIIDPKTPVRSKDDSPKIFFSYLKKTWKKSRKTEPSKQNGLFFFGGGSLFFSESIFFDDAKIIVIKII